VERSKRFGRDLNDIKSVLTSVTALCEKFPVNKPYLDWDGREWSYFYDLVLELSVLLLIEFIFLHLLFCPVFVVYPLHNASFHNEQIFSVFL